MPTNRPTTRPEPSASVGVLLSGGLDSAILLFELARRGQQVVPFYVRTGCVWQDCELSAVRQLLGALPQENLSRLVLLDMPVADLYDGHWSLSGQAVPDYTTPDEAVYLPGRNPLLLLKPALWCRMHGVSQLAIATLSNNPFDDARPSFFQSFEKMLLEATGGSVQIVRPFEHLAKRSVVDLGSDMPLELTFSCLAPVDGLHCGRCNKCAERRAALGQLETGDPTLYAEES
ncbi:MAG: 7-cyano-7-deazaguanine synthase [Pirellulales bacterium]